MAELARERKCVLREHLRALTVEADAQDPEVLADLLLLVGEGAIVTATMRHSHNCPAEQVRAALGTLLNAQCKGPAVCLSGVLCGCGIGASGRVRVRICGSQWDGCWFLVPTPLRRVVTTRSASSSVLVSCSACSWMAMSSSA